MKIAVLASGGGTNLQALIDAQTRGDLSGGVVAGVVGAGGVVDGVVGAAAAGEVVLLGVVLDLDGTVARTGLGETTTFSRLLVERP